MEYMTLIGADSVATAGRQMLNAAETMSQAAMSFSGAMERHQYQMDSFVRSMTDLVTRFEQAVEKMPRPSEAPRPQIEG